MCARRSPRTRPSFLAAGAAGLGLGFAERRRSFAIVAGAPATVAMLRALRRPQLEALRDL